MEAIRFPGKCRRRLSASAHLKRCMKRLRAEQEVIGAELAALRLAGKEKTCRARELMGKRLMNSNLLALFRLHGIS